MEEQEVICPYCGVRVELSEDEINDNINQEFIADCEVCCSPIEFKITKSLEGEINIEALTSDGF